MIKTMNYQLNQWEPTDEVRREDFNQDNAAIDAAIKAVADTAAGIGTNLETTNTQVKSLSDALGSGGSNCRIATGSYIGAGKYGSNNQSSLTLPFAPKMIFIFPSQEAYDANTNYNGMFGIGLVHAGIMLNTHEYYSGTALTVLNVSGTTITWYDLGSSFLQFNVTDKRYYYLALG